MTLSNGCSIPAEVSSLVGRYGESEESFRSAGHFQSAPTAAAQKSSFAGASLLTCVRSTES